MSGPVETFAVDSIGRLFRRHMPSISRRKIPETILLVRLCRTLSEKQDLWATYDDPVYMPLRAAVNTLHDLNEKLKLAGAGAKSGVADTAITAIITGFEKLDTEGIREDFQEELRLFSDELVKVRAKESKKQDLFARAKAKFKEPSAVRQTIQVEIRFWPQSDPDGMTRNMRIATVDGCRPENPLDLVLLQCTMDQKFSIRLKLKPRFYLFRELEHWFNGSGAARLNPLPFNMRCKEASSEAPGTGSEPLVLACIEDRFPVPQLRLQTLKGLWVFGRIWQEQTGRISLKALSGELICGDPSNLQTQFSIPESEEKLWMITRTDGSDNHALTSWPALLKKLATEIYDHSWILETRSFAHLKAPLATNDSRATLVTGRSIMEGTEASEAAAGINFLAKSSSETLLEAHNSLPNDPSVHRRAGATLRAVQLQHHDSRPTQRDLNPEFDNPRTEELSLDQPRASTSANAISSSVGFGNAERGMPRIMPERPVNTVNERDSRPKPRQQPSATPQFEPGNIETGTSTTRTPAPAEPDIPELEPPKQAAAVPDVQPSDSNLSGTSSSIPPVNLPVTKQKLEDLPKKSWWTRKIETLKTWAGLS